MFPNPHTHFCTNALCLTQSQSCQDHIWREKDQNSGCIKTSLPSLLNLYRTTTEMPCPVIALSAIKGEPPWSASLPWLLKWIVLLNKLPKQRLNLLIIRRKLHPSFYKDSLLGGSRSVLTLPRPWKGNMLHMRCSGAQVPQPDCPCGWRQVWEKQPHFSTSALLSGSLHLTLMKEKDFPIKLHKLVRDKGTQNVNKYRHLAKTNVI